ncbi:MAG: hypothetical protein K2X66_00645, partial [Cyanobacteria bacterium]|nr:hypothetical protein [Cyanobacteriota bacterium]
AQIKMMADLGLLDEAPVQVNGQAVVPRDVFAALVTPRLTFQETEDYVIVRISVKGERSGEPVQLTYEIIDSYDAKTGFTAMMRTTAFPVSILAQMMAEGVIQDRGVLPLETAVPTEYFLKELEKRAIKVSMETIALEEAHAHC